MGYVKKALIEDLQALAVMPSLRELSFEDINALARKVEIDGDDLKRVRMHVREEFEAGQQWPVPQILKAKRRHISILLCASALNDLITLALAGWNDWPENARARGLLVAGAGDYLSWDELHEVIQVLWDIWGSVNALEQS